MEAKQPHRLTPKGRATRQRILTIAADRMFKNGVAGTTTDDLQRAGGISPSQIYHYFGDKKSLVKAVIALQTEAVLAEQDPSLSRLDSFEALEAWRDALIELQQSRRFAGGCPLGSLGSGHPRRLNRHARPGRTDPRRRPGGAGPGAADRGPGRPAHDPGAARYRGAAQRAKRDHRRYPAGRGSRSGLGGVPVAVGLAQLETEPLVQPVGRLPGRA